MDLESLLNGIAVISTVGLSAYIGYTKFREYMAEKAYKSEGINDESGLINRVTNLHLRLEMDHEINRKKEKKNLTSVLTIVEHLEPYLKFLYMAFRRVAISNKLQFVRIFVYPTRNDSSRDDLYSVKLQLIYFDGGTKTDKFLMLSGAKTYLFESIEFLRRKRGYHVGVID